MSNRYNVLLNSTDSVGIGNMEHWNYFFGAAVCYESTKTQLCSAAAAHQGSLNEKVRLSHIGYTHTQMTMLRFTALEKTSNQTHLSLQLCLLCLGCYKAFTCCWLPSLAPAGRVCYYAIWLWEACFSICGHSKLTMHFYYIIFKWFFFFYKHICI